MYISGLKDTHFRTGFFGVEYKVVSIEYKVEMGGDWGLWIGMEDGRRKTGDGRRKTGD
ncbi:hypothetical protein [Sediminibacter sp. Hel_I_10]|uniref:hypothetical protein n=1 Tax=Sediminibacter sp. Hel_I_10 TaxID=1392490 RepID=UPI0012DE707D|nr:hypothetical protein [Sediminibacter sp. Hel_I_10]